jgi:saccharopine dehydrogenase (NAD+, L-lysine-forming)
MKKLFLRRETKRNEQRACLSPQICKQLLPYFSQIVVESCPQRIFKDQEYTDLGITIGTKPQNCIVIGLKELPESNDPITDTHVMFGHCYKDQDGWQQMVSRFKRGNGLLLDLEFLMENNRRVAAFGYYAGFAGAAVALDVWAHKQLFPGKEYPKVNPFANQEDMYASVRKNLALAKQKVHKQPRVMVMGALGRCGSGACDFVMGAGIPAYKFIT